ncbi:FAD/NAD(P)-binding domain-containing protein [Cystobasidium minutum MCA 4210]|uniref:FAD/NAD(P)-binding domain-containing protein n=1 Tax=Cystobasidium minutum MCA 4210 TaxID=1397322 RepID=UPI0034CFDD96|eukprot:jgi/Rhomi1/64162/CE64161_6524
MVARMAFNASLRAQSRLLSSNSAVLRLSCGRPSTLQALQHFQSRRNVISSGPNEPLTSQGTARSSNPADPVRSTSIGSSSASSATQQPIKPVLPTSNASAIGVNTGTASPATTSPTFTSTSAPTGPSSAVASSSNAASYASSDAIQRVSGAGAGAGGSGSTGSGYSNGSNGDAQRPVIIKVKRGRFRTWVVRFARTVLVTVLAGTGYIIYRSYINRHPPIQLPHDPAKKNLVILGNGWASTSLLKNLDTEGYNVTVISPRNYFLFTPLLPSVTVGTLESRSIIEPTRFITRHKTRAVEFYEGEASSIDLSNKTITISDNSEIKGAIQETTLPYDYLVVNIGAANQTFGIKGVEENACFLKEAWDAEKIRTRLMDCIETATFKGQSQEEINRLLHMVVVGGGPTGVEYAAELHDFLTDDLAQWYPEIAPHVKITLVEALPNVLPMFSKQLIDYTSNLFKENKIDVLTKTMVKEVKEKTIVAQDEHKNLIDIPYGLLVWATGNTARPLVKSMIQQIGDKYQTQRRGLVVDDSLKVAGAEDVWACGDCTATNYAPTAQVASQQGKYLARVFNQLAKKEELELAMEEARHSQSQSINMGDLIKQYNRASSLRPFSYSHQGSLAYIGSDKAIADVPFFNGNIASGGAATFLFWRSAYISTLFSLRNRSLVVLDWLKVKIFGRDVSRE